MNQKLFYTFVLVAIVCLCLMRWITVREQVATDDNPQPTMPDTVCVRVADSDFIYGHLGDGTGMSCLEFITNDGDTMLLSKTSDYTGRHASIVGTIKPGNDNVYAVMTTDRGEAVSVSVNMTELRTAWRDAYGNGFVLNADSVATPRGQSPSYTKWRLSADNLVMTRMVTHEGGTTETSDTMHIVSMTADTLVLSNMFGDQTIYWH